LSVKLDKKRAKKVTPIVRRVKNHWVDQGVDQDLNLLNINWVTYLKIAVNRVGEEEEDIEDIEIGLQVTKVKKMTDMTKTSSY